MNRETDPRALALGVLLTVDRGKFAAPTLDLAFGRAGLATADAGLATDLVYGTLRRLRWLDASLGRLLERPERLPRPARWVLRTGAYEKAFSERPDYAVVDAWVEQMKARHPRLAGLANAVLRRFELAGDVPPAVRLGVPDFLYGEWAARFGETGWIEELNRPDPLWLTLFPGGREVLEAEEARFEEGPLPGSVRLLGGSLRSLRAFREGRAQPQNPASLLAAQLLEPGPGEPVLDLAGGAGIKAAWLAARGARVTSVDVSRARQRSGRKNLERLGLSVEFLVRDLTRPLDLTAPKVLLDAPCLGSGTLRGHPELRMRLSSESLPSMTERQRRLLATAAAATSPGGVLVYAVCSLTWAEGEAQVERFLRENPEFSADRLDIPLPALAHGHGVYVRPSDGLDGFYYARLRRDR